MNKKTHKVILMLLCCFGFSSLAISQTLVDKAPKSELGLKTSYNFADSHSFLAIDASLNFRINSILKVGGFWKYAYSGNYSGPTTNWSSNYELYGLELIICNGHSKWKGFDYGANIGYFHFTTIQTPPSSSVSEVKMGQSSNGIKIEPYIRYNITRRLSIPLSIEFLRLNKEIWYNTDTQLFIGIKTGVIYRLGR